MHYLKTIKDESTKHIRLPIKFFIFSMIKSIFVFCQEESTFTLIVIKIELEYVGLHTN